MGMLLLVWAWVNPTHCFCSGGFWMELMRATACDIREAGKRAEFTTRFEAPP